MAAVCSGTMYTSEGKLMQNKTKKKRVCGTLKADFQSVLRTLESLFTTFVLLHVRRHKM